MTDRVEWRGAYADPASPLSRQLEIVRGHIDGDLASYREPARAPSPTGRLFTFRT